MVTVNGSKNDELLLFHVVFYQKLNGTQKSKRAHF